MIRNSQPIVISQPTVSHSIESKDLESTGPLPEETWPVGFQSEIPPPPNATDYYTAFSDGSWVTDLEDGTLQSIEECQDPSHAS
jgi:hypothetical protein